MNPIAGQIAAGGEAMGLSLPAADCERLAQYLALLGKWNRGQNLTAITDPQTMVSGHVLDSLAGLRWLQGGRVLDVGSGAGLPGLVLAAVDAGREYVLLDARRKRVQFLLYARRALGLDNVEVVASRLEKYRPEGKFDTLTARAFAAFPELIRLTTPFINTGARLVAWQADDPSALLPGAAHDGRLQCAVHPARVPGIRSARHIVVVTGPPAPASGTPHAAPNRLD